MPETPWFESFFSGLWLEVQRTVRSGEETGLDADTVERALDVAPDARLLDAPCGEGRIALELAARGYRVTGVDRSAPLLEDARLAAAERGFDVTWEQRDLRELPTDGPFAGEFDGAYCFWGSFGYFDDVGNMEQARSVARSLRPGGKFLIDTQIAESLLPRLTPRAWSRVGDILVLEDRVYEHETSRVEVDWTLVRAEVTQTMHSSIRIYTFRELSHLLREAGFERVEGFGSRELGPFTAGAARIYAVATR